MLSMTLASLDQSIVTTALPRMASELGGLAHLSGVVTAFMLTSTIATPILGTLSDLYGRRRLLLTNAAKPAILGRRALSPRAGSSR